MSAALCRFAVLGRKRPYREWAELLPVWRQRGRPGRRERQAQLALCPCVLRPFRKKPFRHGAFAFNRAA